MLRRSYLVAVFALIAIFGVVLGVLSLDQGESDQRSDRVGFQDPPRLEPVWDGLHKKGNSESSAAESLRALRDAFQIMRGPSEVVPPGVQRHIRKTIGASPNEFRFESSQFTPVNGGAWIVSGENVTCISQRGIGGFACDTTRRFARNGAALGVGIGARGSPGRPREFLVQGAAPDWAQAARLEVNGRIRSIPIKSNTYRLRAKTRVMLERLQR